MRTEPSGTSVADAIPVRSVLEEYEILTRNFGRLDQDWKLLLQGLIEERGKHYDVMSIELRTGERRRIHFSLENREPEPLRQQKKIGGRSSQWWRWPLMPPGALLAGLVAAVAVALVMMAMDYFNNHVPIDLYPQNKSSSDSLWSQCIHSMIVVAAFGWAYSLAAGLIAPTGKITASAVMLTIPALYLVGTFLFSMFDSMQNGGDRVLTAANAIALLAAGIKAIVDVKNNFANDA